MLRNISGQSLQSIDMLEKEPRPCKVGIILPTIRGFKSREEKEEVRCSITFYCLFSIYFKQVYIVNK